VAQGDDRQPVTKRPPSASTMRSIREEGKKTPAVDPLSIDFYNRRVNTISEAKIKLQGYMNKAIMFLRSGSSVCIIDETNLAIISSSMLKCLAIIREDFMGCDESISDNTFRLRHPNEVDPHSQVTYVLSDGPIHADNKAGMSNVKDCGLQRVTQQIRIPGGRRVQEFYAIASTVKEMEDLFDDNSEFKSAVLQIWNVCPYYQGRDVDRQLRQLLNAIAEACIFSSIKSDNTIAFKGPAHLFRIYRINLLALSMKYLFRCFLGHKMPFAF